MSFREMPTFVHNDLFLFNRNAKLLEIILTMQYLDWISHIVISKEIHRIE